MDMEVARKFLVSQQMAALISGLSYALTQCQELVHMHSSMVLMVFRSLIAMSPKRKLT